jgi:hypothetical protein
LDSKTKRAELLRMVRQMNDRCLTTSYWAVSLWHQTELDKQAAAELAALKAAQPKPRRPKPVKLTGNVVVLRPDRRRSHDLHTPPTHHN